MSTPPEDEPWQVVTPSMASYFCHDALPSLEVASQSEHKARDTSLKSLMASRLVVIRGAPPHTTAQHIADALAWCGVSVEQMMPAEGLLEGGVAVVLLPSELEMQTCLSLNSTEGLGVYDACGWRWPLSCEPAYSQESQPAQEAGARIRTNTYQAHDLTEVIPPWPLTSNGCWSGAPSDRREPVSLTLFGGLQQDVQGDNHFKLPDSLIQDNASDATDRSTRTPDSKQETLDHESLTGSPGNSRGRGRWKSNSWGPNLAERYGSKDSLPVTTMMIRNIPCRFRQVELMSIIDEMGFEKTYDFFYLPMDSRKNANLGYAFINFESQEVALACQASLDQYMFKTTNSSKACIVKPADIQGIYNNLKHYRKSILNPTSIHKPYYTVPEGFQWSMLDEN